jgi:BlaI family penicillinase repressor
MPRISRHRLAELQLAIMHVLWDRGEASVGEVRDALEPTRPLAYTTVGTMLAKLEEKGQVAHRTEGRVHVYRARVSRDQVRRSMMTDLANRLFHGDVAEMACHLLHGAAVTRDDLAQLKSLIRQKEKELQDGD